MAPRFSALLVLLVGVVVVAAQRASGSTALQNILKNTHQSSQYGYPTDFTREIIPIPVHSHNDYWRDIPFFSALAAGCMSVEADVWLYNDTLYVGHDESSLTDQRTLDSLYINPILEVLQRQNPTSAFVPEATRNGVYDTSRSQTLYLFIDLKTDGPKTWARVIDALQPLRDAGYLARVKGSKTFIPGPVTVIGTGNTALDLVAPIKDRDYFFDAPLANLDDPEFQGVNGLISPIASTNFADAVGKVNGDGEEPLNATQLETVRKQLGVAKERNIGGRYWGTPEWPIRKRNEVWRSLLKEGVTLLNADDMKVVGEYF